MIIQFKAINLLLLLFLLGLTSPFTNLQAAEFDALVVPSLMDSEMDAWYKTPPNTGPVIHTAHKVTHGQMFSLLIFFKGYTADMDDNLHVRYDVQVYDPMGNPTEDRGTDIEAYKGPKGNADSLMLNQTYLQIIFTDKYPAGTYKIKVTAYDKVSNESFTSETPIELVPFALPVEVFSEQEIGEWVMGYYADPTPVKAVTVFQQLVQLDSKWLNDNLNYIKSL